MDEMHFDIHSTGHSTGKSNRDKTLPNNYYSKRALLASGFEEVIFLSENPNELCNRLCLINQEKQAGNDTNKFDNEIIAILDKLLKYKSITPSQCEKNLKKFNLP